MLFWVHKNCVTRLDVSVHWRLGLCSKLSRLYLYYDSMSNLTASFCWMALCGRAYLTSIGPPRILYSILVLFHFIGQETKVRCVWIREDEIRFKAKSHNQLRFWLLILDAWTDWWACDSMKDGWGRMILILHFVLLLF